MKIPSNPKVESPGEIVIGFPVPGVGDDSQPSPMGSVILAD